MDDSGEILSRKINAASTDTPQGIEASVRGPHVPSCQELK